MSKYVIEFERGGSFAIAFDEAAPNTAAAFQKFVDSCEEPYQALCLQGRFSGEEMYFPAPLASAMAVDRENNVMPVQGSIAFNPNPEWSAVCVYWGGDIAEGKRYHNLFARIVGDMDALYEVGVRIWQKGGETVTLKKID
ncbi:MAG: DUF3830 family protein [Firmicutes bacterium]|nr:DUF3830 family protein [Bacillota bacterium]